ncbi:MAG: DEAD/DEAH box helicase [Gammaproteobacteria bacterium]|nr:DEAD/DEAH box helicase [Gammaproteobacteria bacterium]
MSPNANKSIENIDLNQTDKHSSIRFIDLPLNQLVIQALDEVGYEYPTPIQAEIIPVLTEGRDVIGQAQTGTGKTAAFALPILSKIEVSSNEYQEEDSLPQALILAPTRELAIQVADSFKKYSSKMKGLTIATLCGGQDYRTQLKQLRQGSHIVVGTPGRVIDHIERGTLNLSQLKHLVLDEADEMLRMGFIDDVNWILERSPEGKQIALFSATMPSAINAIAIKYLKNPVKVQIAPKQETSNLISQHYWCVNYSNKIDALLRILEISKHDGMDAMIVFARTKMETITIGEELLAAGHRAIVLNGDIEQKMRERSIRELKAGRIDILIATDVAARGLDVDRITHVINYDMAHDEETYLHRIGRTGRAGRSGAAITFVTPGEVSKLKYVERFTKTPIEKYKMPTVAEINKKRIEGFKSKVLNTIKSCNEKINHKENLEAMADVLHKLSVDTDNSMQDIAAAIAILFYGNSPLLLNESEGLRSLEAPSRDNNRGGRRDDRSFGRRPDARRDRDRNSGTRGRSRDSSDRDGARGFKKDFSGSRDGARSRTRSSSSEGRGSRSPRDGNSSGFKKDFSGSRDGARSRTRTGSSEGRSTGFKKDFSSSESRGSRGPRDGNSSRDSRDGARSRPRSGGDDFRSSRSNKDFGSSREGGRDRKKEFSKSSASDRSERSGRPARARTGKPTSDFKSREKKSEKGTLSLKRTKK